MLISSASLGVVLAKIDLPKKQLANGVEPKNIVCRQGLVLAMVFSNVPVCIKQSTVQELQKRWNATFVFPEPVQPMNTAETTLTPAPQKGTTIQGNTGNANAVIETIPASGGSVVNFYITDNDLNISPNGVDIISTKGLLEFTINNTPIQGPDTITETGQSTGKFYGKLELPKTINGRALSQSDVVQIKYFDQSDASGKNRVSVTSVPLSKTYAQIQAAGVQRIGHEFAVTIYEPDANLDSKEVDRISLSSIEFRIQGGIKTTLANPVFDANAPYLLETGPNTGTFSVVIKIPRFIDGKLVDIGAWYEMTYIDTSTPSGTNEKIISSGRIG
jgi:hypothetical protein